MATNTAVADWREESDEILATVLDVLNRNAREVNRRGRKRR